MEEAAIGATLRTIRNNFQDRKLLIWAYCCLKNHDMETYVQRLIRNSAEGFAIFERQQQIRRFMEKIFTHADQFDYERFYQYCVKTFTDGQTNNNGIYKVKKEIDLFNIIDPGGDLGLLRPVNSQSSLRQYSYFQKVYLLFDMMNATRWETVNAAMNLPSPKAEASPRPFPVSREENPLKLEIPVFNEDAIRGKAEALQSDNYSDILSFGAAELTAQARDLDIVRDYMMRRAAKPQETLEQLERAKREMSVLKAMAYIKDDPGWLTRIFGRESAVTLQPVHSPFAAVLDVSQKLPEMADRDGNDYARDVGVLERSKAVVANWYNIFKAMQQHLAGQSGRLCPSTDRFASGTQGVLNERLKTLDETCHVLMAQAVSLDELAASTAMTAARLSLVTSSLGRIRPPLMQSIQIFQDYVLRRINIQGDDVQEQDLRNAGMTKRSLSACEAMTPAAIREALRETLETLESCIVELMSRFQADVKLQAEQVETLVNPDVTAASERVRAFARLPVIVREGASSARALGAPDTRPPSTAEVVPLQIAQAGVKCRPPPPAQPALC